MQTHEVKPIPTEFYGVGCSIIRIKLATLAHNRQFTRQEFAEAVTGERGDAGNLITSHAYRILARLLELKLVERIQRGYYFPTEVGWKWIEGT